MRIVRYLDELPSAEQLTEIVSKLGLRPADILRKKEAAYAELGLQARLDDDAALLRAMAEHPILIERPIVIRGTRAIVGRPPERVLEIL